MARARLTPEHFTNPDLVRERFDRLDLDAGRQLRRVMRRVFDAALDRLMATHTVTAAVVDPDDLNPMVGAWEQAVSTELLPFFGAMWLKSANDASVAFGGVAAFDVTNPMVEQYLAGASNRLSGIGERTWVRAREQLTIGVMAGESVDDLAGRVRGVMRADEIRSVTIARTETIAASNGGSIAGMRALGDLAPSCKEWLSTGDYRTRASHQDANGQVVPIDQPFDVGGEALDVPGDPAGSAAETINCRCTVLFVDCPPEVAETQTSETAIGVDEGEPVEESAVTAAAADTMEAEGGPAMPYEIVPDYEGCEAGAPFAVRKVGTDEALGCHATEAEAQAQIAALYAQESGEAPVEAVVAAATIDGPEDWHAVLMVEGDPSGDGRTFTPGSLEWREAKGLPLMDQVSQPATFDNPHGNAVHVGAFTRIERTAPNRVEAWGVIDEANPAAVEYARKVAAGMQPGISVDCDDVSGADVEVVMVEDPETGEVLDEQLIFHHARIMGATGTPFPAMPAAMIEMLDPARWLGAVEAPEDEVEINVEVEPPETEPEPVVAAAQESVVDGELVEHTGGMLALLPSEADAARLALAGYEDPDQLHVTLVFLADDAEVVDGDARAALHEWAESWAAAHDPVEAQAWAVANFNPADNPCAVYLIGEQKDGTTLDHLHDDALAAAIDALGVIPPQHAPWTPHLSIGYGADPAALAGGCGPITFDRLRVAFGDQVEDHPIGAPAAEPVVASIDLPTLWVPGRHAITASVAAPDEPPAEWFDNPNLDKPTPFTVTNEGRCFGHIHLRGQCHSAFADRCVTVPIDDVDYEGSFHLGQVVTAGGGRVACGQITVDAGHAPIYDRAGRPVYAFRAKEHYDHTGWAGADLRAGADRHGIWVAGALRPGLSKRQLRALMGAKPSVDYRCGDPRIDVDVRMSTDPRHRRLTLIGVAAVNSPGYPQSRIGFDGDDGFALVASTAWADYQAPPAALDGLTLADRIAATIGRTPAQRRQAAWALVHGGS